MLTRRSVLALGGAAAIAVTAASTFGPAVAKSPSVYTGLVKGVAVGGYDPVAYFSDAKPVRGSKSITLKHEGATWRFANEVNRDAFQADPAKYAPQYGGYCAWAVSQGYTAKGDPKAWKIVGGKLYLNYNRSVQKTWQRNVLANIKKGDANWPTVLN